MNGLSRPRYYRIRPLSAPLNRIPSALGVIAALAASTQGATASTSWLGANSLWANGANWTSTLAPLSSDDVIIGNNTPNDAITVAAASVANSLRFNDTSTASSQPITLTGGDLSLTSGLIDVNGGGRAIINSVLGGSAGLSKVGAGVLVLGNSGNTYTGTTTITSGTVVISSSGALGSDSSTVFVGANPAFTLSNNSAGGTLALAGTGLTTPGSTLSRNLAVNGRGLGGPGGAVALYSSGNNTISGNVATSTVGAVETRISNAMGNLTFSGTVTPTQNNTLLLGSGITTIANLAGAGTLVKTSGNSALNGGTLILTGSNTGFTGVLQIDQGTVRVSSGANLGVGTTSNALNFNNGTLEVRTDAPNFNSRPFALAGSFGTSTTGTFFLDHAPGSSVINQTVQFGNFAFFNNRTLTLNGRNGYGFTSNAPTGTDGGNWNLNTNLNGLTTYIGNVLSNAAAFPRSLAIISNGDTLVTGVIFSGNTVAHILTKTGVGTLTIAGNAASSNIFSGLTTVGAGTLSVANVNNLGTNPSLTLGATFNHAGLTYTGGAATLAKNIFLGSTNSSVAIDSSGTGALLLTGNITSTGTGTPQKNLWLRGTNAGPNEISGVILDTGGANLTGVAKTGSGLWVLSGNNSYTGTTQISEGTLRLRAISSTSNVVANASGINFAANFISNERAGGTLEYLGFEGGSIETVGRLQALAGHGNVLLTRTGGTTELIFSSPNAPSRSIGATLDFAVANGGVNGTDSAIRFSTQTASSFLNQGFYFNGSNFAAYNGTGVTGYLREIRYGTDAQTSAVNSITDGTHVRLTGSVTGQGPASLRSLNLTGPGVDFTHNAGATLTLSQGGLLKAGGGSSTISGGAGATITAGATELVIRTNAANDTLIISENLGTIGQAMPLTKSGLGTLVLGGASNAYTGATNINEGTVRIDGGNLAGGTQASVTVRQGATLDINGKTIGVGIFAGAGTLTSTGTTASTFTVGGNSQSGAFSGLVSDNAAGLLTFVKQGSGTFSMGNASNTYSGVTRITAGALEVKSLANGGVASSIGDSSNAASNLVLGGFLRYSGNNANIAGTTSTPSVSTDRLFTLLAGAAIDSSGGFGQVFATRNANNATLIFSNTGDVAFGASGAITLTLTGDSTGDNTLNPRLTDNGVDLVSVTKSGTGVWVLGNAGNSFTGNTTITGGTLRGTLGGSIPANSNLEIRNGTFETSGTITRALGSAAGQIRFTGIGGSSGIAASDQDLAVNIGGGATLVWGSSDFLNTNNLVLGSATSLALTDFQNPIDLGAATRTIVATDNANTFTDISRISGVISNGNAAGDAIIVNGGNGLQLTGANVFSGNTWVQSGVLVVNTIGTTASTSSALGGVGTNILKLGNGTNGAVLNYAGTGEFTDRTIQLFGSTGGGTIEANGSGPLVIGSGAIVLGPNAGSKTLTLQGQSMDVNEVLGGLADSGPSVLTVTKGGQATWILSGTSTYTGNTTAGGGALGIGSDTALGSGVLSTGNGSIFAAHGDRSISNIFRVQNNVTTTVAGNRNLTFTGTAGYNGAGNDTTLFNSMNAGSVLTFNGAAFGNQGTAAQRIFLGGPGTTIINSPIVDGGGIGTAQTQIGVNATGTVILTATGNTFGGTFAHQAGTVIASRGDQFGTQLLSASGGTLIGSVPFTGANAVNVGVRLFGAYNVGGSNSIEFNGSSLLNSGGNFSIGNRMVGGATLTVTAPTLLSESNTGRTLSVLGNAGTETIFNGVVSNGGTNPSSLTINTLGSVTLNNAANSYSGTTTITNGTLRLGASGALPAPTSATTNALVFNPAASNSATLDLNGTTTTVVGPTATGAGASTITNTSGTANLTIDAFSTGGTFNGSITNTGTALNLTKTGAGTSTLSGNTLSFSGSLAVYGGTLNVTGANGLTGTISNLTVSGGSFTAFNNATQPITVGGLSLSSSTLGFDIGGASLVDTVTSTAAATVSGTTSFDIFGLTGTSAGTFNLLIAPSGLTGTYVIGSLGGGAGGLVPSLIVTDTLVQLSLAPFTGNMYWRGDQDSSWSTLSGGTNTNFSIDLAGTTDPTTTPGPNTPVIFSSTAATAPDISTTLDANVAIRDLRFTSNPTGVTAVTVASGTPSTSSLTIAPTSSATGITVDANAGAIAITAPVVAGANQTWSVNPTASLSVTGGLSGTGSLTKAGAGKLIVGGSGAGYSGSSVTVSGGALEQTAVNSLGSATVTIGSGATYYYRNGTAGTVANNLVLNGGTLANDSQNHTYSGNVSITAPSAILNSDAGGGPAGTNFTNARNVQLTGVVSGGQITYTGLQTGVSGGNQIGGTLSLSNVANIAAWTGGLRMERGTVAVSTPGAFTTGPINASLGRLILRGSNGESYNHATALNVDATTGTALLEFSPDNLSATLAAPLTINQSGLVSLGGGGATSSNLRIFQVDTGTAVNFSGGIDLKGNGIIHSSGSPGPFTSPNAITISSISETGGSRTFGINTDFAWGSSNFQNITISGVGTYTGTTSIGGGRVILSVKNALGSGLINITGSSTIRGGSDLSGANAIGNNLTLGANLTTDGTNSIKFSGITTGSVGGNRTLTNSITGPATLEISNRLNISGDPTNRTLTLGGTGNTTISALISNGSSTGGSGITKTGAGTLRITGANNTYSGTTSGDAGSGNNFGVIVAAANQALGTGNVDLRFNTGATGLQLQLEGGVTLPNNFVNLTGQGNDGLGTSGLIRSTTGVNVLNGTLSIASGGGGIGVRADSGSTLTFNGGISGTATGRNFDTFGGGNVIVNGPIGANIGPLNVTMTSSGVTTFTASNSYPGATNVNTGTLKVTNANGLGAVNAGTAGTVVNSGATLEVNNVAGAIAEGITINGTGNDGTDGALRSTGGSNTITGVLTLASTSTVSVIGPSLTLSTGLSGAFDLTKEGPGTLILNGNSVATFTGDLKLDEGTVEVGAAGRLDAATNIDAASQTTLTLRTGAQVFGTINSAGLVKGGRNTASGPATAGSLNMLSGGAVAPGDQPGESAVLEISTGFSLAEGSTMDFDLNGLTVGAEYDQIVVDSGNIILDGDLRITSSSEPELGDMFWLIVNEGPGSTAGTLNDVPEGGVIGEKFRVYYGADVLSNALTGGNDVLLIMVVPEPSVLGSLVSGLVSLAGWQRFRRRRSA